MYNRQPVLSLLPRIEQTAIVKSPEIIVVGAGIGGLASAIELAAAGASVCVLERQPHAGGKIRGTASTSLDLDAGPTVMTLPGVFDRLFLAGGKRMRGELNMRQLKTLAHHRWPDGATLDLFADESRSIEACQSLGGALAGREFDAFTRRAQRIYELLEPLFMTRPQAGLTGMLGRCKPRQLLQLTEISPFRSLWNVLGATFSDARLQQLFARYSTYCGSSPFLAPSTLMLISHVERLGVWRIDGGMRALVSALVGIARSLGVRFEFGVDVERVLLAQGKASGVSTHQGGRLQADAIVINADTNAIARGAFGVEVAHAVSPTSTQQRSLSAVTFAGKATLGSTRLNYHNVFFSDDYRREFRSILDEDEVPTEPTVYICAPDFDAADEQRLFALVNAPAHGDRIHYSGATVERIRDATQRQLEKCGLSLNLDGFEITTPNDFDRRYPGTGGALYGPAIHGWRDAFRRTGSRTRVPGLFVAGGSSHPGSGVPMAALSGQLCASEVLSSLGDPQLAPGIMDRRRQTGVAG